PVSAWLGSARSGCKTAASGSEAADLGAANDCAIGLEQNHLTGVVVGSEDEDLGHEWPDLLWREVHDGNDVATDELVDAIVPGDLSARALDAEWTEVDPELIGGTASFGELASVGHHTDTHIDLLEVLPRDRNARLPAVEEAERRPGIIELEDLPRGMALFGHPLGAPLAEPDAVAVTAPGEVRGLAVDGHGEKRALEGLEADDPSQLVAPQPD